MCWMLRKLMSQLLYISVSVNTASVLIVFEYTLYMCLWMLDKENSFYDEWMSQHSSCQKGYEIFSIYL